MNPKTRHNDRRCVATGEPLRPGALAIRFVRGPDGTLVADPTAKLPGRGAWLTADRAALDTALRKGAFAKALRGAVALPEGETPAQVADRLEALLLDRTLQSLGLARRAGALLLGFDQVRTAAPRLLCYLVPTDAAEDGVRRIRRVVEAAGSASYIRLSAAAEDTAHRLGVATAVHMGLLPDGPGTAAFYEARRWQSFGGDSTM